MTRTVRFCLGMLLAAALLGCASPRRDTITQYSFIDAILAGVYDGQAPCSLVTSQGDTGIGTFDRLDGEMVVLDGQVYKVRYDGSVAPPFPGETTPFACVVRFSPDKAVAAPAGASLEGLERLIDQAVPNQNVFLAIRAHGTFTSVTARSVPAQKKPYPPLVEVTKTQAVFPLKQVSGTLVGFRTPPYAKGIGVPGYHLHFLSDDHQSGGHVLDLALEQGTVEIDLCNRFVLVNPEDESSLAGMDFSKDRSRELEKAEKR